MMHDCDDGPLNIPGERRIRLRLRGFCDRHPEEGDVVYFGGVERVATQADDRAMAAAMTRVRDKPAPWSTNRAPSEARCTPISCRSSS